MSGLLARFRRGDRQALARILTNVENQTDVGQQALAELSGEAGRAHLVGLTGPPGAGKSTLANVLLRELRQRGCSVAVLAIDPSSPLTGGAALGDRIRMLESQDDDSVYLRSMASRGQVGGLAVAAFSTAMVLDAFGFDLILIETVGAGQDEVDIASLADTVVLVQTPGMGDSVQSVKAGILEVADILVVNKADQPGADEVVRDLRQMVRGGHREGWKTPVLPLTATEGSGVETLADEIASHLRYLGETSGHAERRKGRKAHHARMLALQALNRWLESHGREVVGDCEDPLRMSERMLRRFAEDRTRAK